MACGRSASLAIVKKVFDVVTLAAKNYKEHMNRVQRRSSMCPPTNLATSHIFLKTCCLQ